MNYTPQTVSDKLEITKYNLEAEIQALRDTVAALSDFKRAEWRNKWLTNHLESKGLEAYYYNQSYAERLVIRYAAKQYRQSWNEQNESYYDVFPRTESVDVYLTNIATVADLQARLLELVEARSKNLAAVTEALATVDKLGASIADSQALIKAEQAKLDALDYHVRVAFGLIKA